MAEQAPNGTENGAAVESRDVSFSAFKPQLLVEAPKASDAVQFFKAAFGAEEVARTVHPKRKAEQDQPLVISAELKIGSSVFSVADVSAEDSSALLKSDVAAFVLSLETEDVDAAVEKAVGAGAVSEGEVTETEATGRVGKVKDPFGFVWVISSPVKKAVEVEA
ncbi:hypothetical protein Dimus_016949 [Dionaea muscipula]